MTKDKNPDKLSPTDLKLGIRMIECAICRFRFHVLQKQKTNFRNKEQEPQERNDICLSCVMEGK